MGGIPYKSLGCATCKKRKIRCDLEQPQCARCIKKGTTCPGYDKGRNFVHHTMVTRMEYQGMIQRPIAQLVGQLNPLALPASFDMSAEARTQLFSNFLSTFFPADLSQLGKFCSCFYLMARFPSLAGESDLLDQSLISIAAAFMGKINNDEQLKRQGIELYNNAISLMAHRISSGNAPTLDLLYAVTVFITYEILHTDGPKDCLTHIQGSKALMKNYRFEIEDQMIRAMVFQQKWASTYYITNPQYRKELDWQEASQAAGDSALDELFRIVAESSFLLDELERIRGLEYLYLTSACEALLQRCYTYEEKLHIHWITGKAPELGGRPVPCSPDVLESPDEVLPWDSSASLYQFESLAIARTYLLYWVASVIARRVIYQVEAILAPHPDSTQLVFYCSEIARSVAYFLQPRNHMCTGQVVLFAVSQADKGYADCGHKEGLAWSQNMYKILLARGFDAAPIMSDILRGF